MKRNEQKSAQQIRLGTVVSYAGIVLNIVTGLLYTPWMIHQIGQSDYALYTLAISLITMFTIDFGMSAAVSRFVAKYNAENDQQSINNFLGLVYKLYTIISAVVFGILLVLFFCLDTLYTSLNPAELGRFKIIYLLAGTYSVISFPFITFNGILNAYEQFIQLKACDFFNKLITVILIACTLLGGGDVFALVAINAGVGLGTIAIKYFIIRKNTDIKVNFHFFSWEKVKEIFGYTTWSTVGSIAQNFLVTITPSILAIVSNSMEVAIFGFINSIGSYIYTLAMGVDGFFLPKVSRMIAEHRDSKEFLKLMTQVGRFQMYIFGLIAIGFLLVGNDFVYLLMGDEYQKAYYGVICYLIYSVICYPQQIANTMLLAVNKVKERAIISVLVAIINVGLSCVLSKYWGAIGACISICVSICVRTFLLDVLYKRKLDLDIIAFFRKCHLALLSSFILAVVLSYAAIFWLKKVCWGVFIVKVCAITVIYFFCIYTLGMTRDEKKMVKGLFQKR